MPNRSVKLPQPDMQGLIAEADRLVPPRIYPRLNRTLKHRPAEVHIASRVRLPHGVTEAMVFDLARRIGQALDTPPPTRRAP